MLKSYLKFLVSSLLALSLSVSFSQMAGAIGEPKFGNIWIKGLYGGVSSNALPSSDLPVFNVTKAGDATSFGDLLSEEVTISGAFFAEMKKGYVVEYDIGYKFLSSSNVKDELLGEFFNYARKRATGKFSFKVQSTQLPTQFQQDIINACNESSKLSNGASYYDFPVAIQIKAYRFKRGNTKANKRRDKVIRGFVRAKVNCIPLSHSAETPKPFFFETRVKKLGPAKTCPRKIEVRTIIRYRKPATAKFRFYHNSKQSELITIKARKITKLKPAEKPYYLVERVKYYYVDPGQHSFRNGLRGFGLSIPRTVKVDCKPFKANAMWLTLKQQKKASCSKKVTAKIQISANRPGTILTKIKNQAGVVMAIESIKIKRKGKTYVGRLNKVFNMNEIDTQLMAVDSNNHALNSGWVPLKVTCLKALKGNLSFQDPQKNNCPRQAKIAFSIQTTREGKLNYGLTCTGGRQWTGKVKAHKTGANTYLATGVKSFSLKKHGKISCALKTKIGNNTKIVALAGKDFVCNQGPSNDLADPQLPDPDGPRTLWQGEVTIADSAGGSGYSNKQCPRKGQVFFKVQRNEPGPFKYLMSCSNGMSFQGNKPSFKTGSVYKAFGTHNFNITKTRKIQCTLQEVLVSGTRVTVAKGQTNFTCANRNPDVPPGSGDLTVDPKPESDRPNKNPDRPKGFVADPPKCKKNERLVRGKCQKKPSISIICKPGYKKIGKKCVLKPCRKGFKRVGTKCQKISIVCPKGKKKIGNRCVLKPCKPGFKRVGKSCKKIIKCKKGFKKLGNRCVLKPCKPGFKRVGKSCKKIIKCKKGFKKLGNRCVPKPCKGGKIRINGKCVRPAG